MGDNQKIEGNEGREFHFCSKTNFANEQNDSVCVTLMRTKKDKNAGDDDIMYIKLSVEDKWESSDWFLTRFEAEQIMLALQNCDYVNRDKNK